MPAAGSTAKADQRRRRVVEAAVTCFARKGYYGTTTHEIAERAGISQPYIYRLFTDKQDVFAHAVDHVGAALTAAVATAATHVDGGGDPRSALRTAYAALIEDRELLRFLMQANCATEEPRVLDAVRACYARQVDHVRELLDDDDDVRDWFSSGMLENIVAALDLAHVDEPWARVLRGGREAGSPDGSHAAPADIPTLEDHHR